MITKYSRVERFFLPRSTGQFHPASSCMRETRLVTNHLSVFFEGVATHEDLGSEISRSCHFSRLELCEFFFGKMVSLLEENFQLTCRFCNFGCHWMMADVDILYNLSLSVWWL